MRFPSFIKPARAIFLFYSPSFYFDSAENEHIHLRVCRELGEAYPGDRMLWLLRILFVLYGLHRLFGKVGPEGFIFFRALHLFVPTKFIFVTSSIALLSTNRLG